MRLENEALLLDWDAGEKAFELHPHTFPGAWLRSQLNLFCRWKGQSIDLLQNPSTISVISQDENITTKYDTIRAMQVEILSPLPGVEVKLHLGLANSLPSACIKLTIQNNSDSPLILNQARFLSIKPGELYFSKQQPQECAFFSNGWQSWSTTGAYGSGEKQRTSILGPFQNPMVINPGTPIPQKHHHFTGDMFGVVGDRTQRVGLLAGFLSQRAHFGSLETKLYPLPSLKLWANGDQVSIPPGSARQTDWASVSFIDLDSAEPMQPYFQAVAREHNIDASSPVPVGWCSWYHFYENITETDIQTNLEAVVALKPELPLALLQIDDGFETYPGDWFDFDPGFANGLQPLAMKAKAAGLTPGIWLAPYIVHPKSRLAKDHPDWLLRNRKGQPVNAGFVWNTFNNALDLTNPDAYEYTCDVIRTAVQSWGFKYLKLDFLYAAALEGVYQDPTQTRAEVLRKGLTGLRAAAGPDVTLLACGCPLGSALGLADAMRISADVSGWWEPHFPPLSPILSKEPHMPSTFNALQNILTRAPLHRSWWINDPDCLLVRPDTDLSLAEVQTMATAIGLTGGSLLLSDDLPHLPKDRLRIAQSLLPVLDRRARVLDWFDSQMPARLRLDLDSPIGIWHLLAHFNWEEQPASIVFSNHSFDLPENQAWWYREFWHGNCGKWAQPASLTFKDVPPHGVRLIAVRPLQMDQPVYLGSDLHISQGLEVSEWEAEAHKLSLQLNLDRKAFGSFDCYLPWQPASASFGETRLSIDDLGSGIYRIHMNSFPGSPTLINLE